METNAPRGKPGKTDLVSADRSAEREPAKAQTVFKEVILMKSNPSCPRRSLFICVAASMILVRAVGSEAEVSTCSPAPASPLEKEVAQNEKLPRSSRGDDMPEPPKPTSRTTRNLEGWMVRIDDRLLASPNEMLGIRAIRFLEAKLADITCVMPEDKLARLRAVPIVLDLTHGKLRAMQYHPSPEWLAEHGYARDLAKCVHICEAAGLPTRRNVQEQPWVIMHELAHAYHDQVLGFDEPRIREAYERFKKSGHGDSVLLHNGKRVRHYGLTDPKEFFAEMTEAYFGMNDFFPFNRAELMTAEPAIYQLMRAIWEDGGEDINRTHPRQKPPAF